MFKNKFIYLIILILINQIYILSKNTEIIEGKWKNCGLGRYNNHDFIELIDSNNAELKLNIITESNRNSGIVQLYIFDFIIISNLSLTNWSAYVNKNK